MLNSNTVLQALKRQKMAFLSVATLSLMAGLFVIFSLPSIYVSTATILIERKDMFAQSEQSSSAADSVGHRMHLIISMVLSTESIRDMLVEHDLIDPNISGQDLDQAREVFREKAELTFDNVAVVNQYTGKSGMYSQGIRVSFEDEDPQTAFAIAQSLTDKVLAANKSKGEMAGEVQRLFLLDRHRAASERLSKVREEIAAFKNENATVLPELHGLTIRRYEEIEDEEQRTEENIAQMNRDLDEVRGQLATSSADAFVLAADGTRILGADEQLRLLEAEYARARARYSQDHPTVLRLQSELQALTAHTASGGKTSGIEADLQVARQELAAAQQRYSEDHPDVVALSRDVSRLESLLANRIATSRPKDASSASNPAYNRLIIRERSILDQMGRDQRKLDSLAGQLDDVKALLSRMPTVERDIETLTQKLERAEMNYDGIDEELEQLALSSGRRKADLLDRYIVLEPPRLPSAPSKPPKKILLLVLIMISGLAGLLTALLLHLHRDRILNPDDVEALVDLPVYMIPKCT